MNMIVLNDNERLATTSETLHYEELMQALQDKTKHYSNCGMFYINARKKALKDLGARTLKEYLVANNCHVIATKRFDSPTVHIVQNKAV